MALHPRLQAQQRSRIITHLGDWLVGIAGIMLLLGFAILPWRTTGFIQSTTVDANELVFFYLIPLAGLLALAAAGWGAVQRSQSYTATALALVAGSIAMIYFARFALQTVSLATIGSGFFLALLGSLILLLQIYIPRPVTDELQRTPLDQTISSKIRWFQIYVLMLAALAFIVWITPQILSKPIYRIVHSGIQGLLDGSLYALIALGIIIINKATGVFNFGHGAMMLFGGLIMFSFFQNQSISISVAFIFSAIFVGAVMFTTGNWKKPSQILLAIFSTAILSFLLVFRWC